ncbi:MAG: hypothetical protein JWN03_5695 [Nocardia sp.]|uniref:hypothetical protein n=1 Tax=Nocardia sp. TaxID=1821 RepID=UPI002610E455|nr:hypothetical protein [Nocardia sp.]MCU1645420.1 hypothetical protein [Nocardia sp.]
MNESAVRRLADEVLTRYGSIAAFVEHLRSLTDAPTLILPAITDAVSEVGGRHRRTEPALGRH